MPENAEQPPVTTVVTQPANELVTPVIDHSAKIATLEARQSEQENKLFEEISKVRGDLFTAMEESTRGANERVAALEEKFGGLLAQAAKEPGTDAETVSQAAPPAVAVTTPKEEVRYVRRNGRKVKVKK